jgi:murein DD-endopeptidase MepM/ murein hydrolase activator NlpD
MTNDSPALVPSLPAHRATRVHHRWPQRILLLLGAIALTAYSFFTGPRHLDQYPPPQTSPYRLPWKSGIARFCPQSNRGIVSHRGREEFAYDFAMPVGSEVCAARAGTVRFVDVRHDRRGLHAPNNFITIDHGDGTTARYLHLQKGGSLVRVGDVVPQGAPIGLSGNVGRSLGPHLHFEVIKTTNRRTLPISFRDVPKHRGIPRMGFFYRAS